MGPVPERIGVVRRIFDLWSDGSVEQLLDNIHPEFELRTPRMPWSRRELYRGPSGLREWVNEASDGKRGVSVVTSSFRELSDGRVLVLGLLVVATDEQQVRFAGWVCSVADGRVRTVTTYLDREDALRAAGIEESDPLPGTLGAG